MITGELKNKVASMEEKIVTILNEMSEYLSISQMKNIKKLY